MPIYPPGITFPPTDTHGTQGTYRAATALTSRAKTDPFLRGYLRISLGPDTGQARCKETSLILTLLGRFCGPQSVARQVRSPPIAQRHICLRGRPCLVLPSGGSLAQYLALSCGPFGGGGATLLPFCPARTMEGGGIAAPIIHCQGSSQEYSETFFPDHYRKLNQIFVLPFTGARDWRRSRGTCREITRGSSRVAMPNLKRKRKKKGKNGIRRSHHFDDLETLFQDLGLYQCLLWTLSGLYRHNITTRDYRCDVTVHADTLCNAIFPPRCRR